MTDKKKGTGLKWIPITGEHLQLVPKYLLEQVEPRSWDVDRFYRMGQLLAGNPFNVMGVFADKDNKVKGFMWGSANPLDEKLHVHILTVDKEFQGQGIIGEATGIIKKLRSQTGSNTTIFTTIHPEKFEKYGYKQTVSVEMEG